MNEKKEKFLKALQAQCGIIDRACAVAGISRKTYYVWWRTDNVFQKKADSIIDAQVQFVKK